MIPSRSRYGRRMMLLIRSIGIVDAVCSTGIVAPGFSRCSAVPGRQSTKYSPISDCGRVSQKASVRSEPKPFWVIAKSTSARLVRRSTRMPVTWPARTPATLTSAPSTMPNALSSSTV